MHQCPASLVIFEAATIDSLADGSWGASVVVVEVADVVVSFGELVLLVVVDVVRMGGRGVVLVVVVVVVVVLVGLGVVVVLVVVVVDVVVVVVVVVIGVVA